MLPAVGQGAIGVEVCSDNLKIINMLSKINDKNTHIAISAERSFLKALGGGCQTPIGAFATINKEKLTIIGGVFSDDGQKISRAKIEGKKIKQKN